MNYRDFLQKVIYYLINPLIKGMIKIGITPNFITTTGFILNLFATGLMIYAAIYDPSNTSIIGYAGGVIIFAGLFDMMDGRLARLGNMQSTFGALWDSTLDRYSELFTLFGILFYLLANQWVWSGIITFLAIIGSIMVSYVRARGEGLGLDVKVGFMQRPERVVVTAIGSIVCGVCNSLWALAVPMMLIALLANITAFWRIAYCYKQLKGK
ncbi:CDP-alcohol phosphatidyltransferase family protein [Hoylesella nanceiensis]|jgi:CDP-alcohol phosphatidyltransferase family protein|uniref:CDP-alcohol phosphatidyltransferase family protein n=1 Tax=Hoylesella nanceiensis TaxID=425941 RepID=UPI001C5E58EA|nr:CDP-alcohol phosphatidyltransferase family protein [Hoylesella nanceiensis]MBF1429324.1 CDP-alcohol phosphatidyltransferase family protein [Hoylesella nanceiensis]MBW4834019.1 CDP-alcohol phosphatidyltransferase family protein [Hoylesella nanceiensis]